MSMYIGVKLVDAMPMTRAEFNLLNGWNSDYAPGGKRGDGYVVTYPDGYKSWCPKDAFERANIKVTNNKDLKTDKPSVSQSMVDDFIDRIEVVEDGPKTTIIKATLKNGFVRVAYSSCVSPENYDPEIGKKICIEKIKDEIWSNLGFLLQSAVHGFRGEEK